MKKTPKFSTPVSLAAVGLMVLSIGGCLDAQGEIVEKPAITRPVKAIQLPTPKNAHTLAFPATAKAAREMNCSFRVGGTLVRLNAETGQKVVKNQLIARVDSRDFKIAIKTLEARLAASRAKLEEASLQYKRFTSLFAQDAAAKAKYDSVKAAFLMLKAQVEADSESLKDAKNALTDTRLKAPFTGYVHRKFVENHETVAVGQPIVSLVDLSSMEVELGLPEKLVNRVSEFQTYTVLFDAIAGKEFTATLKEVGKKPDPASRSYPMTLMLDKDAVAMVRPGMAAKVRLRVAAGDEPSPFVVPVQALFNRGGKTSLVWIFDPESGVVRQQTVSAGNLTPEGVEITGKLKPGKWIVTAGVHHLQDGQKVRLLKKPTETNAGGML
jgi:RND family efflux transporter MFP subunit